MPVCTQVLAGGTVNDGIREQREGNSLATRCSVFYPTIRLNPGV